MDAFQRAGEIMARIGSAEAARQCANEIARLHFGLGDVNEGLTALRRGLTLAEQSEDQYSVTDQLRLIGKALAQACRADEADAAFSDALARAQTASDLPGQADALASLGQLRIGEQRMADAVLVLQQATALAQVLGGPARMADVDALLGDAMLYTGDLTGAVRHLERAAAGFAALGQPTPEAMMRSALAAAYTGLARGEDAIEQSHAALELGRQLDEPLLVAEALGAQADAYLMQGRPGHALPGFSEATDIAQAHDKPELWARYLEGKANALRALDRFDEAQQAYDEALDACRRTGDADRAASITINLASLQLLTARIEEAVASLTRGIAEARRLGNDWLLTIGLSHLAEAHWQADRPDLAREALGEARQLAEQRGYSELQWRQAVMGTRLVDLAEPADMAKAQAELVATIEGLTDAPGAGPRPDMLRELAILLDGFFKMAPGPPGLTRFLVGWPAKLGSSTWRVTARRTRRRQRRTSPRPGCATPAGSWRPACGPSYSARWPSATTSGCGRYSGCSTRTKAACRTASGSPWCWTSRPAVPRRRPWRSTSWPLTPCSGPRLCPVVCQSRTGGGCVLSGCPRRGPGTRVQRMLGGVRRDAWHPRGGPGPDRRCLDAPVDLGQALPPPGRRRTCGLPRSLRRRAEPAR